MEHKGQKILSPTKRIIPTVTVKYAHVRVVNLSNIMSILNLNPYKSELGLPESSERVIKRKISPMRLRILGTV